MKAAVIDATGGIDVLKVREVPTPEPKSNEVRVRLKFAALNHLDLWVRRGMPGLRMSFPHILGADGAGIVDKVGSSVTKWRGGEEVIVFPGISCGKCERCLSGWESLCDVYQILGEHRPGTTAEFVVVPEENIFAKPKSLSFEEAAAAPLVYITAWQMLVRRARVKSGDLVLVHAAGSGVSSAGIQIAIHFGAHVIATAGTEEKLHAAKSLGAREAVSYKSSDYFGQMKALAPNGFDIVFDHVGADQWANNIKLLRWGGTLVTCGATSGFKAETDLRHVFYRQLSILGSTMGSKQDFSDILKLLGEKKLRAVVGRSFALDSIASAHAHLEAREQVGKVLIKL